MEGESDRFCFMDSAKVCCGDKSAVIRLNDLLQEKQLLEALKGEKI